MWGDARVLVNGGVRATYWDFNEEMNISPRAQIAIKPNWQKDMTFRFNTGIYYQPPFYREVRDLNGQLNKDVKAQQSIQDRKSTRLNSSHVAISYAIFCLQKN